MWLVKAPKPPLDEQIPQASIAPGDISAEQAEAMADAAHLQRWKEIWAEIAAKRQSAEPLTHKESSRRRAQAMVDRSEEHTSELQSLMRISYAVFCLKKKTKNQQNIVQYIKHI